MFPFSEQETIPFRFQSVSKMVNEVRSRRLISLLFFVSKSLMEPATVATQIKLSLPFGLHDTALIYPSLSTLTNLSSIIDVTDIFERFQILIELSYPTDAI